MHNDENINIHSLQLSFQYVWQRSSILLGNFFLYPDCQNNGCHLSTSAACRQVFMVIDHFTVSCLVAGPLNESEAGDNLVLIETSLLFSC